MCALRLMRLLAVMAWPAMTAVSQSCTSHEAISPSSPFTNALNSSNLLQVKASSPARVNINVSRSGQEYEGIASCFGNYENHMSWMGGCGYGGNYIDGENFKWTTALCTSWARCGSCYAVECIGGQTANMGCQDATTYVRAIDGLPGTCAYNKETHIFDLSSAPFDAMATELGNPAACSGRIYVKYKAVNCNDGYVGLVSGGMKVGIMPGQTDPACPEWFIANVGGPGALFSVETSADGGTTWYPYQKAAGIRWDCTATTKSQTNVLNFWHGKSISFRMQTCDLASLPATCEASGDILTFLNLVPANWCPNGMPCPGSSWEAAENMNFEACNWQCYLDRYVGLQNAFGATNTAAAAQHYENAGRREGRDCTCPPAECNWQCYLDRYPPLQNALGATNLNAAQNHWEKHGQAEGRNCGCPPAECDWQCYLNRYPGLQNAFGATNTAAAQRHYEKRGQDEGRNCACTPANCDWQCYLDRYPGLKNAYGNDLAAAQNHYEMKGHVEGRNCACPPAECNWQCYLDRYPGLQNAFGPTNTAAAQAHYENHGQAEGRDCTCPDT